MVEPLLWLVKQAFHGKEVPIQGTSVPFGPPERPSPDVLPQECPMCRGRSWWRLRAVQGAEWMCDRCSPEGAVLPVERAERW